MPELKTYPHFGQRNPPMLPVTMAGPLYTDPHISIYQLKFWDMMKQGGALTTRPGQELERIILSRKYKICA